MVASPSGEPAGRRPLSAEVDAVVCGGGPAGSTFASFMASRGRRVVLLERERFPRFHIGESLLPWNLDILERLGVLDEIRRRGTQVKRGARFYHQGSDRTRFVEFARGLDPRHQTAFQVKRAEFDALLLDRARELGAEVHEEATVEGPLLDPRGRVAGVTVRRGGMEGVEEVRAKVVVDATGRDAVMSRTLGGRRRDPKLERSAAFAHYDGFHREPGPRGGDIVVVTTPDGWWWLIPFSDGTVSVGIVMPSHRFRDRRGSVEELHDHAVLGCPQVAGLLRGFRRTTPVHAIADYSYRTSRIAADGLVSIGDAAMFLDPVFSTGVLLAMTSAEMAVEAVDGALRRRGRVEGRDFRRFERVYRRGVNRYARYVHGFYQPHFLEAFYSDSPPAPLERSVTTILAGGVFHPGVKERLLGIGFFACVAGYWIAQRLRGRGPFERATGLLDAPPRAEGFRSEARAASSTP